MKKYKFGFGIVIGTVFMCALSIGKNINTEINQRINHVRLDDKIQEYPNYTKNKINIPEIKWESDFEYSTDETNELYGENNTFQNRYAYSVLNESQKQIYKEMYQTIMSHKDMVRLTTTELSQLNTVYDAINSDYGEIFWINGYNYNYNMTNDKITEILFSPIYLFTYEERTSYQYKIENRLHAFLSGISQDATDYEKSKYVYETLIRNVKYNTKAKHNQTILSVFLDGETVCEGYACAAQYMLSTLGIQSFIVRGDASGEPHAWNALQLDGDWYYFDVTWGNSKYQTETCGIKQFIDYGYLNITKDELLKTRSVDVNFLMPECDKTKNNYFVKEDRYIQEWDIKKIQSILSKSWLENEQTCSIKFKNQNLYEKAVEHLLKDENTYAYCDGLQSYTYFAFSESNTIIIYFDR